MEDESKQYNLKFQLIFTIDEYFLGWLICIDKSLYSGIKDITDKNYYTNSFYILVYHNISVFMN